MLKIAGSLLGGFILSWFGFDHLVIHGMLEVFGQHITTTGYYFFFAMLGALKSIISCFIPTKAKFDLNNPFKKEQE